ncbi:MAG: hypothetical protein FJ288_12750 [Planctomycetes bacterium]|nr:hypothetical protein [Planctomycetota bacterium]
MNSPHPILAVMMGAATAFLAGAPADADDPVGQVARNRRDLASAAITAPDAARAEPSSLDRAIERLRGIQFKPRGEPPADDGGSPAQAAPPAAPLPAAPKMPRAEPTKAPAAAPNPALALDELNRLTPEQVPNPVALADTLYLAGRCDEAFIFYERAASGQAPDEAKAWAVFQMANCRRASDPAAAAALYKRVAAEHPKTPWASIAALQDRVIQAQPSLQAPPAASTAGQAGRATPPKKP